jgi:hypothetical protein
MTRTDIDREIRRLQRERFATARPGSSEARKINARITVLRIARAATTC